MILSNLGLDTIRNAEFIFQICVAAEYRENFDLTNINSCGLYGLELTLPGVHSDIGGSYLDDAKEISVVYSEPGVWFSKTDKIQKESEKFKEILIKEGWFSDEELEIKEFSQRDVENKSYMDYGAVGYYFKGLVATRKKVSNAYDKIPLNIMFYHSSLKQFGVKYIPERLERKYNISNPFIQNINNQLNEYVRACVIIRNQYIEKYNKDNNTSPTEYINAIKNVSYLDYINEKDLKELRRKYLHWSVKTNKFGLGATVDGAVEEKKRKRHIQNG